MHTSFRLGLLVWAAERPPESHVSHTGGTQTAGCREAGAASVSMAWTIVCDGGASGRSVERSHILCNQHVRTIVINVKKLGAVSGGSNTVPQMWISI